MGSSYHYHTLATPEEKELIRTRSFDSAITADSIFTLWS